MPPPRGRPGTGFTVVVATAALALTATPGRALPQQPQNPSPMVEHTRAHRRLTEARPPGRREALALGTLFVPERLVPKPGKTEKVPLAVVFHAGSWLPEVAGHEAGTAIVGVQLTAGSGGYSAAVQDPQRFPSLVEDAERRAGVRLGPVTLAGWSAGCGAIRELLRQPDSVSKVDRVIAIDGIHTDYVGGKPGPLESRLETGKLEPWLAFAREAGAGRKRLLVLHTEIFPGTFGSTTETADWLLRELGLRRRAVARWGPMGTVLLSDTRAGRLRIQGYAGNS
ncbi:MAG TPA: hypothetical protein VLL75_12580, partial [Vicinamibacteria bacterium]|nr:hypothetical protein [Vicinamibacteria bacterium]